MIAADQSSPELLVSHLGTVPYRDALALQIDIRASRLADELPDTLLLLEHPPVYTRGRRSAPDELTMGESFYRARSIDIVDTDRGGRVTYHGPGQLVGYPIMRIHDIGSYLRTIESVIIDALADYGIAAHSRCAEGPDYTGVWVKNRKIASIGVHVSRGITTHGFAVNVSMDLDPFSWIVACGLPDVTMTSLARELPSGPTIDPDSFRARIARHFCAAHHRDPRPVPQHELGRDHLSPEHELMRGRTPRTHALGIPPTRADAGRSSIGPENPTPDTVDILTHSGAPV